MPVDQLLNILKEFKKFLKNLKNLRNSEKLRETGNVKHLYRNELDKVCSPHNVTYSHSKYLSNTTISDKILKDRAYKIARNRKYDGHQRASASMVYKFFEKKQDHE